MDFTDFTEDQVNRYARHILLKEVGGIGQAKLLSSRVLVIGAGGLGSPVLLYLAAAGVGTIGVIDDDTVDLSNLQRQIVHQTASVGTPKVESAKATLAAINPDVTLVPHFERITPDNALDLMAQYDLVADGSDNFETRFLINDAAYFKAHETDGDGHHGPCYRCIFREAPPPGQIPSCAEAGVLGALCGTMGSLQATEILKELLGIGDSLSGHLMVYEGLAANFRKIKVKADPGCPLCGDNPTITDLSSHEGAADGRTCAAG
jgi:adenylyltransferase/sulfurtransferase